MSMVERQNVGKSFATKRPAEETPDRAAGLGGILPPRAAPVTEVAPIPVKLPESAAGDPLAPAKAPFFADTTAADAATPEPARESVRAPASGGGGVAVIGVYLTPALLQQVREVARAQRLTYADLLVEAFDHISDTQLAATFTPAASSGKSTAMPQRMSRRRGAPGIQINMKLSREQREWLDAKAVTVDAPSRSALVAETFRLYMGQAWASTRR